MFAVVLIVLVDVGCCLCCCCRRLSLRRGCFLRPGGAWRVILGSPGGALGVPKASLFGPRRPPGCIWAPNGRQGSQKTRRTWHPHSFLSSFGYILVPIRGIFLSFFWLVFRPSFFMRFLCIFGVIFDRFWEPKSIPEAPRR